MRLAVRALGLSWAALMLAFGVAPAAHADTAPFSDPNQNGLITLCDSTGHRLTSGDIRTIPFVHTAISSSAAPKGYESGLATLYAYQPIQYVDPGDWTGYQLSGSTYYSNPNHPGAEMTPGDGPLVSFTSGYPLHWDGLLQLRLYYTARFTPQYAGGYPTAILQVKGTRWTAVQVGTTPCNATKTKSFEELALKRSQYAPSTLPTMAAQGAQRTQANGHGGFGGSGSTSSTGATNSLAADRNVADRNGSSWSSPALWLGIVAATLLAAGPALLWWRHRASAQNMSGT
jgi:hypothetical protein